MYAKLIFRNARRSVRDYLIYIVTMTICVTLFYSFLSISSSYYHPDIGSTYDFTMLGDGMKMAICAITLILLFLIWFVNGYMLRRRQKEFALQSIMGMEQRTIGRLFFAETFLMGGISVAAGIFLGAFCSQFITAMLLTSYGQSYRISWMLFPDTVLLTVVFFSLSFVIVGLFNTRAIRKTKIIDMLSADRENEPELKKSRFLPAVTLLYLLVMAVMLVNSVRIRHYYFDPRYALPVHIMFWSNILFPALGLLWPLIWLMFRKRLDFPRLVAGEVALAVCNAISAACVPGMRSAYLLSYGAGVTNQYIMFVLADLLYVICGVIYLASAMLVIRKNSSPERRYYRENLFFYGQMISKLTTTSKTMTLVCATLAAAIVLFMAAPVLVGWSSGYLDVRSVYDVQIFSRYNDVYDEADLPRGDYDVVTDFLGEHHIEADADCTFNLYLPRRADFDNRRKHDFPVLAISLSDYNAIRRMLGYAPISLEDGAFTTQWQTVATEEEREEFLRERRIETDTGSLTVSGQSFYLENIGQTAYNTYTSVVYVFPDSVCAQLLPVMRNRYISAEEPISYEDARELEQIFTDIYPEDPTAESGGVSYGIRLSTLQINSARAGNFVLQASMIYGAVVLMVICLTVLSLQQLLDAGHYRYRFSVLRKLGVEEPRISRLVWRQLGVWFGLPVGLAVLVSAVVVIYFIQTVSTEISAYIGFGALAAQIAATVGILVLLFVCYFISTWLLFRRAIDP